MSEVLKKSKIAPKIFVVRGPPGSGKSTVSNELAVSLVSNFILYHYLA
jgi:tRNA uridine 5-carbamoylmethylation protein Kti12